MDIDMAVSVSLRRLIRRNNADEAADVPRRGSRGAAIVESAAGETVIEAPPELAMSAAHRKAFGILMSARSHLRRALAISDAIR